jgi:hypothetical protein
MTLEPDSSRGGKLRCSPVAHCRFERERLQRVEGLSVDIAGGHARCIPVNDQKRWQQVRRFDAEEKQKVLRSTVSKQSATCSEVI